MNDGETMLTNLGFVTQKHEQSQGILAFMITLKDYCTVADAHEACDVQAAILVVAMQGNHNAIR